MSGFFLWEDKVYFHHEFCTITEALVPKPIVYGMPPLCNDKKLEFHDGHFMTWFVFDNNVYQVRIDSGGQIGFARHISGKPFEFGVNNYVMDQSLPMTNSLQVFNHVFYLLLLMADKTKQQVVKFNGAHNKLDKTYNKMMKNTAVLKYIDDHGWRYHTDGEFHYLIRK